MLFNIDIAAGIKAIIKRIRKPADEVFEVIFRWLRKKVNKFRKKGKGKDEKKETKEESKKDMKEGKDNKLTKKDKAMHRRIIKEIEEPLLKPGSDKDYTDINEFYKVKLQKAKDLTEKHQSRIKKGIKLTIKIQKDSNKLESYIRIAPNMSSSQEDIKYNEEIYILAFNTFKGKVFKMKELKDFLKENSKWSGRTIQRRIEAWKKDARLFTSESKNAGVHDSQKDVSFEKELLVERVVTNQTKRSFYGYRNPDKDSQAGLAILRKGLIIEKDTGSATGYKYDYEKGKEFDKTYMMTKARYKCRLTNKILEWGDELYLGHKPNSGASQHWNKGTGVAPKGPGHKQTRIQNQTWNHNSDNYHGPEYKYASKKTGGSSENYGKPSKQKGSHPMWWDKTHSDYKGEIQ